MMSQTLQAVFENGGFRLLESPTVPLSEGQRVRLIVEPDAAPDDVLALAAQVYDGLSEREIDEIEQIALDRRC